MIVPLLRRSCAPFRLHRLLPLGLAVVGLLGAAERADAQSTTRAPTGGRAATDSVIVAPPASLFAAPLSFETTYLSRVAEMVLNRKTRTETTAPAQDYARRYGISRELAQRIIDIASAEGVDPELGFRVVRVESRFVARARGPGGSLGLMQLMPSTARVIDRSVRTEADILDPQTNLRLGFMYLRQMIERYDGDVRLGVLAYNRGSGAVDRALNSGRDPENGYSHKVLGTQSSSPYRGLGLIPRRAN
jgi:soluble lytic murein transglycosylase-like protein